VTPTYLIPKRQRKLLSKIMPYLSELEEIRIKGLSDKAVIVSADPRYTIHYFDRKILSEILRIMPNLNYLFIDVAEPHLEINCSLREKEAKKVLNDLLTLCMDLLSRIIKIRKGVVDPGNHLLISHAPLRTLGPYNQAYLPQLTLPLFLVVFSGEAS